MNKFEQVLSVGHQILVAGGPRSDVGGGWGLNSEIPGIMGNGLMETPPPLGNRLAPMKTLSSRNFVGRR